MMVRSIHVHASSSNDLRRPSFLLGLKRNPLQNYEPLNEQSRHFRAEFCEMPLLTNYELATLEGLKILKAGTNWDFLNNTLPVGFCQGRHT